MAKSPKRKRKTARKTRRAEAPFHPLYGAMKGIIRIMPGVDITQPADPDWADYLDAKYGPELRKK